MKFIADENIPLEVITHLKTDGIDIVSLSNTNPGIEDEKILILSNEEKRTLITFDKDFGELVFKLKKKNNGIILLRFHSKSITYISSQIKKILNMNIEFEKSFCVVEANRIRIIQLKI